LEQVGTRVTRALLHQNIFAKNDENAEAYVCIRGLELALSRFQYLSETGNWTETLIYALSRKVFEPLKTQNKR